MVQGAVPCARFLGEEVTALAKQRSLWIQGRPDDPRVEVVWACGGVIAAELPPVSGGAADDGVYLDGQPWVGDLPELCG